jgi:methylenetetrahydrofolate reductase (NADPH)
LRGDPPKGQANWESCKEGFEHADDLVRYIREKYDDYFCIAVAGKVLIDLRLNLFSGIY